MQVYINFAGLPSWLAIRPLKKIVSETDLAIDWHPMLGNLGNVASTNLKAGEQDPLAEYKARRALARSRAKAREHERMCETLGIDPDLGGRKIDPTMLALGLLWVKQQADSDARFRFVESAFEQTYRESADVESATGVGALLQALSINSEGFDDFCRSEAEALEASRETTLEKSVLNAPAFILDDEVFNGREHLPLIEWILQGRQGTPPV